MPDNEFLRHKREREFQQRVLAAVGKPQSTKFIRFINAPAFLWVISVVVLTIGGGYVTNHKQCLLDAGQIISRRNHLRQELNSREMAYDRRISETTDFREAFSFPDKRGSTFTDLAALSYSEVQTEFLDLTNRVTYALLTDAALAKRITASRALADQHRDKLIKEALTPLNDEKSNEGVTQEVNTARILRSLKLNAALYVARQSFEYDLESFGYYFQPDCSLLKTVAITLGYTPPIVFAAVSPVYSNEILSSAMDAVEKAQKEVQILENEEAALKR